MFGKRIRVGDVFTPDDDPTYTYVARSDEDIEAVLRDISRSKKFVVSISGPSKSGKTVTVRRVFGDNIIEISGSNLAASDNLWDRVLDWMDVPHSRTSESGRQVGGRGGVKAAVLNADLHTTKEKVISETFERTGYDQVVAEIGGSDFVIFIDDFHYIENSIQEELSRQIKAAFEAGVRIITASVPHRSEDLLRGNPELRGRLINVDVDYWIARDLAKIAEEGFKTLNVILERNIIERFAKESCGSPQLMQGICQFFCFHFKIESSSWSSRPLTVSDDAITTVLSNTTVKCNFGDLLTKLHSGPKTRGTERKIFKFTDGTRGDVYRPVLLGLRSGEPKLSIKYDELLGKIKDLCPDEIPVGSSIVEACKQMGRISDAVHPGARVIDWDEAYETLNVSDPYFLFYLRCSPKITALGERVT